MNKVRFKTVLQKNAAVKTSCSALLLGGLLALAGVREAAAEHTLLPLRCETNGVHIHNGVTSQTIETSFGANPVGLAFTGTTTYDFYSPSLTTAVALKTANKGGGNVFLRNNATTSDHDFSVTARMEYFDYDPATGLDVLLADTTATPSGNVTNGQTVDFSLPNRHALLDRTLPAGHLLHIAVIVTLTSGNPGNFGQLLCNGPSGESTVANFPQNGSGEFNWALAAVSNTPPTIRCLSMAPGGGAQLSCTGPAAGTYLVQATTNLLSPSSWVTIGTIGSGTNGLFNFTDPDATNYPCRYYRLALQ